MMPDLGKYAFSVLVSYGASFVLLAALVGVSVRSARRAARALAEYDKKGAPDA